MVIKFIHLIISLFFSHSSFSQDVCLWRPYENHQEYQPKWPYPKEYKLTLKESLKKWNNVKKEDSRNYTYMVRQVGGFTAVYAYTQIDVRNDTVASRKFKSVRMEVSKHEYKCKPDIQSCPVKRKVDSLRAIGDHNYKKLLEEHVSTHTILVYDNEELLDCWEEFGENVGSHDEKFGAFPAITLDSVYSAYTKYFEPEGSVQHRVENPVSVNENGIIVSIPAVLFWYFEPPKEFLWDYDGPPVYYLVRVN